MGHTVGVVNLVVKLVVKLVVIYTPRRGWGTHPLKELMLLSSRRGGKKTPFASVFVLVYQ